MKFTLRLSRAQILSAIKEYVSDASETKREDKAFAAGDRIAAADFNQNHLDPIFNWKSPRPKSYLNDNDPNDIIEALRLVTTVQQERTAMAVLCGLHGVSVPMASAILTAINRERFTVIDWRSLNGLGIQKKKQHLSLNDYLAYLSFCRTKSKTRNVTLRELDRALWIVGGR